MSAVALSWTRTERDAPPGDSPSANSIVFVKDWVMMGLASCYEKNKTVDGGRLDIGDSNGINGLCE